jgi:hypothetical protein
MESEPQASGTDLGRREGLKVPKKQPKRSRLWIMTFPSETMKHPLPLGWFLLIGTFQNPRLYVKKFC